MEESDFVILFSIDIQACTHSIHNSLCLVESRVTYHLPNQMTENFAISGMEEWKSGRKGKECAMTTQYNLKRSQGSPVTIFSLYMNVYKLMYGDFTKDEKEKSQYQDTICSEEGLVAT